jgi:hypothetical protein
MLMAAVAKSFLKSTPRHTTSPTT